MNNNLTNEMMSVEYVYGPPPGEENLGKTYHKVIKPIALILLVLGLIAIIRRKTSKKAKKNYWYMYVSNNCGISNYCNYLTRLE